MFQYDVFISCKNEDYPIAEIVYDYLTINDIKVFLSSKELRRLKESEYIDGISEALDSSYHLLILSSSPDYVKSRFVKFDWTTFLNEILSGRKQEQMMTIIKGMTVGDLPVQLRHYESFTLEDYKGRLLPYAETPDSKQRKEDARFRTESEEEARRARFELERRKEILKNDIESKEANYIRFTDALEDLSHQIIEKRKESGDIIKTCPVCDAINYIENRYCDRCGWTLLPRFDIHPKADKDHLFKAKSVWNALKYESAYIEENAGKPDKLKIAEEIGTETQEDNSAADSLLAGDGYVDLGLPSGLLWTTCNVGVSRPEEVGDYFAWSETKPKNEYDFSYLKYRKSEDSFLNVNFSKYSTSCCYDLSDDRAILQMCDDAAYMNWGGVVYAKIC